MTVMKSNRIALAAKVLENYATRLWIDGRREFCRWRLRLSKRERKPVIQLLGVGLIRVRVEDRLGIRRREEEDEGKR
jgi:hypothetical protein